MRVRFERWSGGKQRAIRRALVVCFAALCIAPATSAAQDTTPPTSGPQYGWREVWTGGDAMRDVWLLYTGITLAPWSEHVYDPGWRLRVQSGYGQYDYTIKENGADRVYPGSVNYVDALAGYHWKTGALTAKVFAGVSFIDHAVRPDASRGRVFGPEWGPKAAAELWFDVAPGQWTSLNVNFTTAHNTFSARWRYGWSPLDGLSAGPELRIDSNGDLFDQYEGRAGLFAAYKWDGYEVTVAGGIAAYMRGTAGEEMTPYATINLLTQF